VLHGRRLYQRFCSRLARLRAQKALRRMEFVTTLLTRFGPWWRVAQSMPPLEPSAARGIKLEAPVLCLHLTADAVCLTSTKKDLYAALTRPERQPHDQRGELCLVTDGERVATPQRSAPHVRSRSSPSQRSKASCFWLLSGRALRGVLHLLAYRRHRGMTTAVPLTRMPVFVPMGMSTMSTLGLPISLP
jgi:hypothetical protein